VGVSFNSRKKMWFCLGAVVLLVFLFPSVYVWGVDDLYEERDELEEQIEQIDQELEEAFVQENELENEIKDLEREIEETEARIQELNREIEETEAEIQETEQELEEAEEELAYQEELLTKRLRAMQKRGNASFLEVLFNSTSFGEFLTRFNDLRTIADNDIEMMEKVAKERDRIASMKEELEDTKAGLEEMQQETVERRDALEDQRASLEDRKADLAQQIEENERLAQEMDEKLHEIEQQIVIEGGGYDGGPIRWPVDSKTISSPFGYRTHPITGRTSFHGGIDIPVHAPVYAAEGGEVTHTGYGETRGNYIRIYHGNDLATRYLHLSEIDVSTGDTVVRGDTIGYTGTTGSSTGIHLHFDVYDYSRPPVRDYVPGDRRHDPEEYLE